MKVTALQIAERFIGTSEVSGRAANPQIMAMLHLDGTWPQDDSVPWCSGFMNYVSWLLRLPRSKSLLARSWLNVGEPVDPANARRGFDVVILKRGQGEQPGPEDTTAPGHVGFFAGRDGGQTIALLGGNQSDSVGLRDYSMDRVLGIRRLWDDLKGL